jgi:hypothetical protein
MMPQVKPLFGTPLNKASPYANGLVRCWLFNEGSGVTAYDSSGLGNHGTLTNMANPGTPTSGWTSGPNGGALAFDGIDDYVVLSRFSVAFSINSAVSTGDRCLLGDGVITDCSLRFHNNNAFDTVIGGYVADAGAYRNAPVALTVGTFTRIVTRYAQSVATVYQDGKKIGVDHTLSSPAANMNFALMGYRSNFYPELWNGLISDVMIWNRALSATEISYLSAFPYTMFEPSGDGE